MEELLRALARFIDALVSVAGSIVGFVLGWGLFEVTEWRRRRIEKAAIRGALISRRAPDNRTVSEYHGLEVLFRHRGPERGRPRVAGAPGGAGEEVRERDAAPSLVG